MLPCCSGDLFFAGGYYCRRHCHGKLSLLRTFRISTKSEDTLSLHFPGFSACVRRLILVGVYPA
jgi:hypothetical protein